MSFAFFKTKVFGIDAFDPIHCDFMEIGDQSKCHTWGWQCACLAFGGDGCGIVSKKIKKKKKKKCFKVQDMDS